MSKGINRDRQQMTEWEKQYEESIPVFVDKMTKLSMEEVKLPRDRDRFIQEEIRDKAWISKREGFPEYDKKFFNSAIKERRKEIVEEQREEVLNKNPLLEKRQIRKEGGLLDTDSKRMQYSTGTPSQKNYTPKEAWTDFSGKVVEGYAAPYTMPTSLLAGVTKDVQGVNKITGALADGVGALSDSVKAVFNPDSWQIDRSKPKTRGMLPSFTQDRQDIVDENIKDIEEESSRKEMNEGGETEREKYFLGKLARIIANKKRDRKPGGIRGLFANREEEEKEKEKESALEYTPVGESYPNRVNIERPMFVDGGDVDNQMSMLMERPEIEAPLPNEETPMLSDKEIPMLPDEEMEEDYVEYVFDSTLDPQDKEYLENALEEDAKLSEIIDRVVESATEFSGSGPIEGPGSGKSDSIPARLSDGKFVVTAKATEEIGADNLMSMMKDAEAAADERQSAAYGGYMTEKEDETAPIQTSGLREARRNVPQVAQTKRQVEEEMLKSSPRRFYQPISG